MQRLKFQQPQKPTTFKGVAKEAIRGLTGYDVSLRPFEAPPIGIKESAILEAMEPQASRDSILLDFGVYDPSVSELHITHTAGLYSCITVTLWMLTDLLSEGHLTRKIDFTWTLDSYKDVPQEDLYPKLFVTTYDEDRLTHLASLPQSKWRRFDHHGNYGDLPFETLNLLIDLYLQPNPRLAAHTRAIRDRYIRPDQRYLGVCYRGTDKATEVMPIDSAVYLELAERLLTEQQVDRILIQTDQAQVSNLFQKYFAERCDLIDKLPRTGGTVAIHNEAIAGSRLEFAQDMISAVTLLAEMEQVIVYTGNVGVWIVLMRGAAHGVWQATPAGISAQFK